MLTPDLLHDYQKRAVNFQCSMPETALWLDPGLGEDCHHTHQRGAPAQHGLSARCTGGGTDPRVQTRMETGEQEVGTSPAPQLHADDGHP